jgi:hypothetical protein
VWLWYVVVEKILVGLLEAQQDGWRSLADRQVMIIHVHSIANQR